MSDVSPPSTIALAARHLEAGRLIGLPTETVYGLAADATQDAAVAAIFVAKGRPRFNPLIIHVPDLPSVGRLVVLSAAARRLAQRFWPGPLTLILPRRPDCPVSLLASAGLDSLAIRIPAHPLALALLRACQRPLAAPSANRSGRISPTSADDVRQELGERVALVLDGGPCRVGIESTVLDLTGEVPVILRPGGITRAALEAELGAIATATEAAADGQPRPSPGLSASHYAPQLPVRLNAGMPRPGEAFLAFGPPQDPAIIPDAQLSARGDTAEAAARLFASLRALDRPDYTGIAVMPIPPDGLGAAINDRLQRAAADRSHA